MLEIANQVRRKKAMENQWYLYEYLNKNPNLTVYDLSKKIEWSVGKVAYYIKKLLKGGLIHIQSVRILRRRRTNSTSD